jgi:hypothetical protein
LFLQRLLQNNVEPPDTNHYEKNLPPPEKGELSPGSSLFSFAQQISDSHVSNPVSPVGEILMCRCLVAVLLFISSTAFAQSSRRSPQFPSPHAAVSANKVSKPADDAVSLEQPQFSFTIHLWTASERIIEAVLAPPSIQMDESPVAPPFEGWQPHSTGKTLLIRSFETRVKLAPEITGGPALIELSDQQLADFIDAAQRDSRSNVITAPKLTVFCEQVGQVQDESKVPFLYKGTDGKQYRSSAIEGTRIFVRTTRREDGEIEADAQIELHALPNRHEIPLTEDHVLSRPPEQTVTTMALSGILKKQQLHLAMISPKPTAEPELSESLIQRAGFFRKQPSPVTRTVAVLTVSRLADPE